MFLDACLSREKGTKRKLSQRTLLEFNFPKQSKAEVQSSETDVLRRDGVCHVPLEMDVLRGSSDTVSCEDGENDCLSGLQLKLESVTETDKGGSNEMPFDHQGSGCHDDLSLLSSREEPAAGVDVSIDDISGATLRTFIVGRRFSDEKVINSEIHITLLREPQNVKDPNAIKVNSL